MTNPAARPAPKRLQILDDEEIEALYGRPSFTPDERTHYFTLPQPEHDMVAAFGRTNIQIYCILQLGYFKAKQLFFAFTFHDVADDVSFIVERYFPTFQRSNLRPLNKRTILKQRRAILERFRYRFCTVVDREHLFLRAQQAARISSKPIYVLREVLRSLSEQRLVSPGYSFLQEAIVGKALIAEQTRLTTVLQTALTTTDRAALDGLFAPTDGLYTITLLKREPKDFSLGELRREIARSEQLLLLYHLATRVVPLLAISNEGITYYASLVSYYSVFRLQQLDPWVVALYLLCFVFHRYQRLNDNLLTCFIHLVNAFTAGEKVDYRYEQDTACEQHYARSCPTGRRCHTCSFPNQGEQALHPALDCAAMNNAAALRTPRHDVGVAQAGAHGVADCTRNHVIGNAMAGYPPGEGTA